MGFFGIKNDFFRPAAIKVEPAQIDPLAGDTSGFVTKIYAAGLVSADGTPFKMTVFGTRTVV